MTLILDSITPNATSHTMDVKWQDDVTNMPHRRVYDYREKDQFIADVGAASTDYLADYDAYIAWGIANYVPPPPPTVEQIIAEITTATQSRLDTFARTRNYDGILSACTYATSTNMTFAAEGQYAVTARDNTWAALYTIMAEVQAGTRAMPTSFADVEPDLPVLVWQV